jgi:hypothetical protein
MSGRLWEGPTIIRKSHYAADAYNRAPTCPGLAPNISFFPAVVNNKNDFLYLFLYEFYAL